MKRLSPKDEAAAITLLESGNAVIFFTPEEMKGVNTEALMAAVTAAGFEIIFEVQRGERCSHCLDYHNDGECPALQGVDDDEQPHGCH